MKVLLSWLREMSPIEGDPTFLGEQMSDLGMAVESMEVLGEGLDAVVVAEVASLRPHPDADRVQLVEVRTGDGATTQVVCGAFNMSVGDRVPLATVGAVLPGGMEIQRRRVRGEWSEGMLCSASELGLGSDHAGIVLLDPAAAIGEPVGRVLGLSGDVLWDLEVNPNRPDALSIAGVARDLAARLGVPFAPPLPADVVASGETAELTRVEIEAADLCGRFVVKALRGVEVGPSPAWLANRLRALGMRPVNNVVDVSNYVMLELGQPSHAFDLAAVPEGELRVRWARDGEVVRTLDGVERELASGDGVVAGGDDVALSIAGLMGGASSEISESTTDVLMEAAWWRPMAIARSSQRLALRSEASMRFERGTDPMALTLALDRIAELLAASGARPCAGVAEGVGAMPERTRVEVSPERVGRLLGVELSAEEIVGLLEPIGFATDAGADGDQLTVEVPTFRPDVASETDVAEEVARHHGYSKIPATLPRSALIGSLTRRQRDRRLVRDVLVGAGVDEAMPIPLISPSDLARAGLPTSAVPLANPLTSEESVLRPSLRPGLLQAIGYNASHRNLGVRLFEVGNVFGADPSGGSRPSESEHLAVGLAGPGAEGAVEVWRLLVQALGIGRAEIRQTPLDGLHPSRSGLVLVDGSSLGVIGEVDPAVVDAFGISERVGWLELDLDVLLATADRGHANRKVSRFPSTDLDLAFVVADDAPAAAVEAALREAGGELLADVRLFDVFRGEALGPGQRSLAFTLRLQAPDRTLTDEDIAHVRQSLIDSVITSTPSALRS